MRVHRVDLAVVAVGVAVDAIQHSAAAVYRGGSHLDGTKETKRCQNEIEITASQEEKVLSSLLIHPAYRPSLQPSSSFHGLPLKL